LSPTSSSAIHGRPAAPQLFAPYAHGRHASLRVVVSTAGDPLARGAGDPQRRARDSIPTSRFPAWRPAALCSTTRWRGRGCTPRYWRCLPPWRWRSRRPVCLASMNYAVAQRSREISIRMALGARAGEILRMVIGRALLLASLGVAIGIAAAFALGRVIQGQLFGVTVLDPITLGGVVLVLAGSAVVASALPARRAAAIDPGGVLR
jgi:hypothetical protein